MAFVAKYVIDNEGVYQNTKAANIAALFKCLGPLEKDKNVTSYFTKDSAVTVFSFRNLLLTSLISSMVHAYMILGESPKISFSMDDDLKELFEHFVKTYYIVKGNVGAEIKKEVVPTLPHKRTRDEMEADNNTSESNPMKEKIQKNLGFQHNLTPFQILLMMYCRWVLLKVQWHEAEIIIDKDKLYNYAAKNNNYEIMRFYFSKTARKNATVEDFIPDKEGKIKDNTLNNFVHGTFRFNFIKQEYHFYHWYLNLKYTTKIDDFGQNFKKEYFQIARKFNRDSNEDDSETSDEGEGSAEPAKNRRNRSVFAKEDKIIVHKGIEGLECDWNDTFLQARFEKLLDLSIHSKNKKVKRELVVILNLMDQSSDKKYHKILVTEAFNDLEKPIENLWIENDTDLPKVGENKTLNVSDMRRYSEQYDN